MRKLFLAIVGVFLILIGIAGLILPILPGWLLIFLGLSFIAPEFAEKLKKRIFRKLFKHEIVTLDEWKKYPVRAGFTTRHFPLLLHKTDDLLDPSKQDQLKGLLSRYPPPGAGTVAASGGRHRGCFLNQVHGDNVVALEDPAVFEKGDFYHAKEADGVITNIKDLTLLVLTADCLSIFFYAPGWTGLVHAGWRGTEKKIAQKVFQMILGQSKCRPSDVQIAFGPRICKDHYEVGEEFKNLFPEKSIYTKSGKTYFDLAGENKRQLLQAGAVPGNILDHGICTVCENEDFYSFRKEKEAAGRMVSFIVKS